MRRLEALLVIIAAAAIGWLVATLLEGPINAWLFTLRGVDEPTPEPFDEPGGGW